MDASATQSQNFSATSDEILDALYAYHEIGEIIELRIPTSKGVIGGFYNNLEALARDARHYSEKKEYDGIFITINKINPDLQNRVTNSIGRICECTTDKDISEIRYLPIDLDPKRQPKTSSTDEEHNAASERAFDIWIGLNWPNDALIMTDSGNGFHLLARVQLENTPDNVALIKQCLEALDYLFSDAEVEVDLKLYNPGRILKLPGTWACKGENTPERPYRESSIISLPEKYGIISKEQLEALARLVPKTTNESASTHQNFDPVKYAEEHGSKVIRTKDWNGWKLAILDECPFDPNHSPGKARIGVKSNGARYFGCFHNSCNGKDWKALKELWEEPKNEKVHEITDEELGSVSIQENPKLEVKLESDNAIMRYIEYGKATCDAYPEYHYSMALNLVSISTNRRLVLKMAQQWLYPNIWAFNLGRSTISRKSAAGSKGENVAKELFPDVSLPHSYSPEGLTEELTKKPRSYLFKDEAAAMLAAMQKNYMLEMRDLYCILYDNQSYSRKLRSGQRKEQTEFDITDPFINMWCATTPDMFRENTSILDLTSGWLMRFLYFYPNHKKEWMAFKPANDDDYALYHEVLDRMAKIKELFYSLAEPVEIKLSPEAWEYYQAWQESREKELQDSSDDIELALWGRLSFYALKLSILFTIGRIDYKIGIDVSLDHIKEACRQVDAYFIPIGKIVVEEVAQEQSRNVQNKILGILRRKGGKIQWAILLQNLHLKVRDVEEAIGSLTQSEEVEVVENNQQGKKNGKWVILKHKSRK